VNVLGQMNKFLCSLLYVATLVVSSIAAHAETVTLRVADYLPIDHFVAKFATYVWMDEVRVRTNGKVKFDYFPAEQLGKSKDLLSLTQSGVTDVGMVSPSLITDKLPLAIVAEHPLDFSSACEGTAAYWPLAKAGGILDRYEFEPLGVQALFVLVTTPYQLYMTDDPITGIEAVQGKKIRITGGAKVLIAKKIGAVPVQISSPELMEALSRGTVDGMMLSPPSVVTYGFENEVRYATRDENFGNFVVTYMINREKLRSLPPDIRQALLDAGEAVTRSSCGKTDLDAKRSTEQIGEAGVTFMDLDPDAHEALMATMSALNSQWAADLDKRGKPGTLVLEAFQRSVEKVRVGAQQ
jgi:TRAP-type C4-dicarboxylate transport system substrate-binding protein